MALASLLVGTSIALLASAGTASAFSCAPSTAHQLTKTLPIASAAAPYPGLGQTICMDFTGDGRTDIVFTVWTAMNHGAHFWAAFRRAIPRRGTRARPNCAAA